MRMGEGIEEDVPIESCVAPTRTSRSLVQRGSNEIRRWVDPRIMETASGVPRSRAVHRPPTVPNAAGLWEGAASHPRCGCQPNSSCHDGHCQATPLLIQMCGIHWLLQHLAYL